MSVQIHFRDDVAVLLLHNPPVNALSCAMRRGIMSAVHEAAGRADVQALVLAAAPQCRTWPAGADIAEFGSAAAEAGPSLAEVCHAVEACAKPVVAALRGTVFGGGLELALGCHWRLAMRGTKLGLPEVRLGILPGAGGTQRLPRLVGAMQALQMISSGAPVAARPGDGVTDGDALLATPEALLEAAVALARSAPAVRRVSELPPPEAPSELFDAAREQALRKGRGAQAPLFCIEAVRAAVALPSFAQGMAVERSFIHHLMGTGEAAAMRALFFAERSSTRLGAGAPPPGKVARVGVVGAGTMGRGIAMSFLSAGLEVVLVDVAGAALEAGLAEIRGVYQSHVDRGRLSPDKAAQLAARLTSGTELRALRDCDVVIEAVVERLPVKRAVFRELEAVCRPDALLATNTSSLDIDDIVEGLASAHRMFVLHFFAPARVQRIVEVAPGRATSAETMATGMALCRAARKLPVPVGNCRGFVGNRMLTGYRAEAEALMEEGVQPWEVDAALTSFGMAMGPFQIGDLSGLDIGKAIRDKVRETAPERIPRAAEIADRLVAMGRLGMKAGRGYYRYAEGSRTGRPDEEVSRVIAEHRERHGLGEPRRVTQLEIRQRLLYSLVNEGFKCIEDGMARSPADIDVIWVHGYGFPPHKGGPMHWAAQQDGGLGRVLAGLAYHAKLRPGVPHLEPARSLVSSL